MAPAKSGGFGRSLRTGAVAAVLIVALAVAAIAFVPGLMPRETEPAELFVLVIAGPGEDGVVGARIIAEVDLRGATATISAKDPGTRAEIAGTGYDRLSDAYAFGGGEAVVAAAYRSSAPYIALDADRFAALAKDADGVRVDVPEDIEVFTGDELLSFRAGARTVDGREALWLLEGAQYLTRPAEDRLRSEVAEEVLRIVSGAPGGIAGLVERGEATSNLESAAFPSSALR